MRKYDLNDQLIRFAVDSINFLNWVNKCIAGSHISKQLIRSAMLVALNYREAQAAESRRDFIHKMRVS